MDESGKFQDSEVVVYGFVVALNLSHVGDFVNDWAYLLHQNGIQFLEMKEALKLHRPLSEKVSAMGVEDRIAALKPFVLCIRRHFHMISRVAIDVKEYKKLPEQYREMWGNDPGYTAFARSILEILSDCPKDGIINLYCDDEEEKAWPFYQLYRKIKIQYQDARERMKGITFADDRLSFALQASDSIASLIRLEARLRFRNQAYDFKLLYDEIEKQPQPWEKIIKAGVAWCDKDQLSKLGEHYREAKLDHKTVLLSDLSRYVE